MLSRFSRFSLQPNFDKSTPERIIFCLTFFSFPHLCIGWRRGFELRSHLARERARQ